jgi:hypothetical protein
VDAVTFPGSSSRCPACDEPVDPFEDGVHYAVQIKRLEGHGGIPLIDGTGGFFHEWCKLLPGWRMAAS